MRVSPDGASVALRVTNPETGDIDVWTYDITRGTLSRLTTDPALDAYPLWTLDRGIATGAVAAALFVVVAAHPSTRLKRSVGGHLVGDS